MVLVHLFYYGVAMFRRKKEEEEGEKKTMRFIIRQSLNRKLNFCFSSGLNRDKISDGVLPRPKKRVRRTHLDMVGC